MRDSPFYQDIQAEARVEYILQPGDSLWSEKAAAFKEDCKRCGTRNGWGNFMPSHQMSPPRDFRRA